MIAPVAFFGHGTPLNTLESNPYTDAWRTYGRALVRPRAILVFSAHWYVAGTRISEQAQPATIHDFNATFPRALFDFTYPASGAHDLVTRVEALLGADVQRDTTWGIDHGAYSVLAHVVPDANVPIAQVSLDRRKTPREHYEIARRLAPLRDEGVLMIGSGNVVHNLELGLRKADAVPFDWALRYETHVQQIVEQREHGAAIDYARGGDDARLAIPTPEHYLPLLYTLALQRESDRTIPITAGIAGGANSMLSFGFA